VKLQEKQKREKMRFLFRTEAAPYAGEMSSAEFHDLEANSQFREAFRSRGHLKAREKRLRESEANMADLERWYKNRDYDRFERHRNTMRSIYS